MKLPITVALILLAGGLPAASQAEKPRMLIEDGRAEGVSFDDTVWVTDITYIRTHEGWSYLAVVIDLFSRWVVGWSMQSRMTTDLALQALLLAPRVGQQLLRS